MKAKLLYYVLITVMSVFYGEFYVFAESEYDIKVPPSSVKGRHCLSQDFSTPLNVTTQDTIFSENFEPIDSLWKKGDIRETNGLFWHIDTFNAYSGKSWWCGHPEIKGYRNNWYQTLTTPDIDLTNTSSPMLSFMHYYGTEYDYSETPEQNPWDGCNVRISVDGGQSYNLITPIRGYNAPDSLWVWEYHGEIVPGGLPGWHGLSNAWYKVVFDLSEFVGQVINLRFIFASDPYIDTRDNEQWLGWFLDDITVKDGSTVLFFDDGEDSVGPSTLVRSEGTGLYPDGWTENTSEFHSPTRSWTCDDSYNLKSALISPWIGIPEKDNVYFLTYWIYLDLPDKDGDNDDELDDYYQIEMTKDGVTWERLFRDYVKSDESRYNWELRIVELEPETCQKMQLRIVVMTDDNNDGGTGAGIYLDDFVVTMHPKSSSALRLYLKEDNEMSTIPFPPYGPGQSGYQIVFVYSNTSWAYPLTSDIEGGVYEISLLVGCYGLGSADMQAQVLFRRNGEDTVLGTSGTFTGYMAGAIPFYPYYMGPKSIINHLLCSNPDVVPGDSLIFAVNKVGGDRVGLVFIRESNKGHSFINVPLSATEVENNYDHILPSAKRFFLYANYPNPFNPETTIEYQLPKISEVTIKVFNMTGQLIKTLVNQEQSAGDYIVTWNGKNEIGQDVASGVYLYKVETKDFVQTRKMLLIR